MNRIRNCAFVWVLAVPVLTFACKPKETALTRPPSGFKDSHRFARHDDAGGTIFLDVAVGAAATIVDRSVPPTTEVALGWISNTGTKKEKVYGFEPSDKAQYFLYARTRSDGGGWRIEEVKKGGKTDPTWRKGAFTVCDTHKSNLADVGFKDCVPAGGGGTASSTTSSMALTSHASMTGGFFVTAFHRILAMFQEPSLDAPGWAACIDGCCTW